MSEGFKPISVKPPSEHPILFRLRCLVDLQLDSIVKKLRPELASLDGKVLDVGAGQSPWKSWLPDHAVYTGIDVSNAQEFGMDPRRHDIVYYDGRIMPLDSESFDAVLCIEVLEHAEDPQLLASEMHRVLRSGGILLLSVPWSARLHHLPHDYHRFSPNRLSSILDAAGFSAIDITERGSDVGVIANKMLVLAIRLSRPRKLWHLLWALPCAIVCGLLSSVFLAAAHIVDKFGSDSGEDPLGYFVKAIRN